MPAGVPCDATLTLSNLNTTSVSRVINGTPTVTTMPYTSGPAAGGGLIIVTGQNLSGVTVSFNGTPMTITSNNATAIVGNAPPGTPGPATVLIRNANGCQTTRTYTYL